MLLCQIAGKGGSGALSEHVVNHEQQGLHLHLLTLTTGLVWSVVAVSQLQQASAFSAG